MRVFIATISLLTAACSAPRYTYYFPQPDASVEVNQAVTLATLPSMAPPSSLQASASVVPDQPAATPRVAKKFPADMLLVIPSEPGVETPPEVLIKEDPDLRRAAIFGAGGLVALVIGGNLFWVVGSLSLLIGLIFAIKWLLRK